jgi:hypothetical protein
MKPQRKEHVLMTYIRLGDSAVGKMVNETPKNRWGIGTRVKRKKRTK